MNFYSLNAYLNPVKDDTNSLKEIMINLDKVLAVIKNDVNLVLKVDFDNSTKLFYFDNLQSLKDEYDLMKSAMFR